MAATLISIIGPPAVGKTTLAEGLCQAMAGELIREDYAGNPFLAPSYDGDPQARLPGQLYFLFSRLGQLSQASWPAAGLRISDYGFCQDGVFAKICLCDDDYRMYERMARRLEKMVQPPDVLIALDADVSVLLDRIAGRGRGFEKSMDAAFLDAMRSAYRDVLKQSACPVIRIDAGKHDLRQADCLTGLVAMLRKILGEKGSSGIVDY